MASPSLIRKHSVVINGRKTSVTLEPAFWRALKTLARDRGMEVSAFAATINAKREHNNLSSALRLAVLDALQAALRLARQSNPQAQQPAE
jgi:predicted DNA-binding ribbon-helix-helix protein